MDNSFFCVWESGRFDKDCHVGLGCSHDCVLYLAMPIDRCRGRPHTSVDMSGWVSRHQHQEGRGVLSQWVPNHDPISKVF